MGAGGDKKQELLGLKLKSGILIGKKASNSTPSTSWKLGFHNSLVPNFSMNTCVSARKIGANLWEVQPQFNFNSNDADDHGHGHGDGGDLIHQRRRRQRGYEKDGLLVSDQLHEEASNQPIQLETSLRRNIVELPSLRHLSVDKNSHELQHISSASCCSSMQVTPYACAVTPPTGYTLNTSTHLLKVLNRIWNLEEQHSRNTVLIKSLKRDLEISQAQIKTLVEERKMAHQEINELKRSTHEIRKQKVARSTKDELLEIKSLFMREKKARILLESLCDEFAKGIRDYEQKVRFLQQNHGGKEKDFKTVSRNEPDRLILHVSEAWLDERAQMKCDISENTSISDNLCCEIEMFLEAKKKQSLGFEVENDDIHEESGSCGVITLPCSPLVSRMIDGDHGRAEPSSDSMSKRAPHGAAEPSPKPMVDQGPEASSSSRQTREAGVRANSLMAKLVEARLESQFSKSRTVLRR